MSSRFGSAACGVVICGRGGGNGAIVIIGSYASIITLDSMFLDLLLPWGDELWKESHDFCDLSLLMMMISSVM